MDRPDLNAIETRLLTGWPRCADCGIVQVDEDGCCGACGKDAVLPDTDKALDHAPADISALLIYARSLESALTTMDEQILELVEAGDAMARVVDVHAIALAAAQVIHDWDAVAYPEREGTTP